MRAVTTSCRSGSRTLGPAQTPQSPTNTRRGPRRVGYLAGCRRRSLEWWLWGARPATEPFDSVARRGALLPPLVEAWAVLGDMPCTVSWNLRCYGVRQGGASGQMPVASTALFCSQGVVPAGSATGAGPPVGSANGANGGGGPASPPPASCRMIPAKNSR